MWSINVVSVYFVSDQRKQPARKQPARKQPARDVSRKSPPRDVAQDLPPHVARDSPDVDAQIQHLPEGVPVREGDGGDPDIEVVNKIHDDNDD